MNKMQEWLLRAAKELNLRVDVGHEVKLQNGEAVTAQAYFPDLSNPRGILVFEWSDQLSELTQRELNSMGFGASIFGEPGPKEQFDIEGYKEMFAEWGWSGVPEKKPTWMPSD